jgi:hypothetical protein
MITREKFIKANLTEDAPTQSTLSVSFNVSKNEVKKLQEEHKEDIDYIQIVRNKFRAKKYLKNKELNPDFEFHDFSEFFTWYKSQPRECYYCKINESVLFDLYDKGVLFSKRGLKRGKSLEIERRNSKNNDYSSENCVLACYFCNNHKSDIITEEDHRKYFADNIRNFLLDKWEKVSNKSEEPIKNPQAAF